MNNRINFAKKIITVIIIAIICFLMINSVYIHSITEAHYVDSDWNSIVSYNLAFKGKYMTSQPYDEIFAHCITTGESFLVFQSLIYKIFGVNHFTTILGVLIFALIMFIISVILVGMKSRFYILTSILLALYLFSHSQFHHLLIHVYGELPAICYSIIAFYLLYIAFESNTKIRIKKQVLYFLAGGLFMLSLFAKFMMIFLVVSIIGILLIDGLIVKNVKPKLFILLVSGMIFVFLIDYIFRLIQFEFSFEDVKNSYFLGFSDMYVQIGYDNFKIFDIGEFFVRINGINDLVDSSCGIIFISLPVIIYLLYMFFRKETNPIIIYMGICASSVFVYYAFFGTVALSTKRMFPYYYLMLCFYIYIILLIIKKVLEYKKLSYIIKILLIIVIIGFRFKNVCFDEIMHRNVINNFLNFDYDSKTEIRQLEDEYIKILKELPLDSKIITASLNPVVTLYTNYKPIIIYTLDEWVYDLMNGKKVYLVCNEGEEYNWYYDYIIKFIDDSGISLEKINKLDFNYRKKLDPYGIYKMQIINKNVFENWLDINKEEYEKLRI